MTMTLYQGGVGTYLKAIFAQVQTLQARIEQVTVATRLYQADCRFDPSIGWRLGSVSIAGYEIDPISFALAIREYSPAGPNRRCGERAAPESVRRSESALAEGDARDAAREPAPPCAFVEQSERLGRRLP